MVPENDFKIIEAAILCVYSNNIGMLLIFLIHPTDYDDINIVKFYSIVKSVKK